MIVTNDLMQSNGQAYETGSETKDERIAGLEAQLADYKAGAAAEAKAGDEARRQLAEAREGLIEFRRALKMVTDAVDGFLAGQGGE